MGGESRQALIPSELTELVARKTGVDLDRGGLDTTFADFVRKRCRTLGLSPAAYAKRVLGGDAEEERVLLAAISIPHTWFFRDRVQLELALDHARKVVSGSRPIRVWVPGCATGEDVYSLSTLGLMRDMDLSVLGTDISSVALEQARRGLYEPTSFRDFPADVAAYFTETGGKRAPIAQVRQKTSFEWHNLMDPVRTAPGGWDLIICRNVVIYFSRAAAVGCAERLGEALGPRGVLVLGAGELAAESPKGLRPSILGTRVMLVRAPSGPPARGELQTVPLPPGLRAALAPHGFWPSSPHPTPGPLPPRSPPPDLEPDPFAALLQAGDLSAAGLDLERMAHRNPRSARTLLCLGIVFFARGDYEGALGLLARAAESDASLWPVALYQGLCRERLDRPALDDLLRAQGLLAAASTAKTPLPVQFAALAAELLELAIERSSESSN